MDSVSDKEAGEIWKRVKKYINPSSIKSSNPEGIAKEIEQQMQGLEVSDESGSMKTLVEHGFPKRAVKLSSTLQDIPSFVEIRVPKPKPPKPKRKPRARLPPTVKRRANKRLAVVVRGRTRIFAEKNIKITIATWKDKPAFWFYNSRQKKLVTWGLIK